MGCTHHVPDIYGSWLLNNGSIMEISKDEFIWYQNATKKSYYAGTPEILTQEEALDAIQVPESNRETLLQKHVYYFGIIYDTFVLNGQDNSTSLKSEKSEFAFQMNGINSLSIVNLNTNEEFSAVRQEE